MERYVHKIQPPSSDGRQVQETQFGRWIKALNKVFDMTQEEMALRINYDKGSFSEVVNGKGNMGKQVFNALLKEYKRLAEERQIDLSEAALFLTIAWLGEDLSHLGISLFRAEEKALKHMEWLGGMMEEVRRLRKENERFKGLRNWKRGELLALIAQLEQDKEDLQRNIAWLKLQQREVGDS